MCSARPPPTGQSRGRLSAAALPAPLTPIPPGVRGVPGEAGAVRRHGHFARCRSRRHHFRFLPGRRPRLDRHPAGSHWRPSPPDQHHSHQDRHPADSRWRPSPPDQHHSHQDRRRSRGRCHPRLRSHHPGSCGDLWPATARTLRDRRGGFVVRWPLQHPTTSGEQLRSARGGQVEPAPPQHPCGRCGQPGRPAALPPALGHGTWKSG
jgi:hypothetical protein